MDDGLGFFNKFGRLCVAHKLAKEGGTRVAFDDLPRLVLTPALPHKDRPGGPQNKARGREAAPTDQQQKWPNLFFFFGWNGFGRSKRDTGTRGVLACWSSGGGGNDAGSDQRDCGLQGFGSGERQRKKAAVVF